MANTATATTTSDNIHELRARHAKADRFVEAIVDASRWTGGKVPLVAVADGIEAGTVDLSRIAKTIDERAPSLATTRLIVRSLRLVVRAAGHLGRATSPPTTTLTPAVAAAFAEIGRAGAYADRCARAKKMLELVSAERLLDVLHLGDASEEMIRAVEAEIDWQDQCEEEDDDDDA